MRISIVGSGYVGLVSGAGLAEAGHEVVCMDIDAERVANLCKGHSPIFEPGLDEMLTENAERGLLSFTTSMEDTVNHATALMIAVGTPPSEDGSADLGHVLAVVVLIDRVTVQVNDVLQLNPAVKDDRGAGHSTGPGCDRAVSQVVVCLGGPVVGATVEVGVQQDEICLTRATRGDVLHGGEHPFASSDIENVYEIGARDDLD